MGKNKRVKKQRSSLQNATPNHINNLNLLPIAFIIALVPLIVFLKVVPLEGVVEKYWTATYNLDFFSYYKSVLLISATAVAFCIFILRYYQKKIEIKRLTFIYVPLGLFALFILLSTIFAEHKNVAFFGFPDRYEGGLVLLSYLAIAFFTVNMINKEKHARFLISALFISATILGVIGIFQFFGLDLFQSAIGKSLILPASLQAMAEELTFTFGRYTIYATLYNTNYVGSYTTLVLSISLVFLYFVKEKRYYYITFFISCLMFATLLGSNSRAGMVGIFISLLLILLMLRKVLIIHWKRSISIASAFIIILLVLNFVSEGKTLGQVTSLLYPIPPPEETEEKLQLTDIELGENTISFVFNQNNLTLKSIDGQLILHDGEGNLMEYEFSTAKGINLLKNESFPEYGFLFEDGVLLVYVNEMPLHFLHSEEGFRFINLSNEPILFESAKSWGFEGREKIGSSRGYIWSRSLPLIGESFFLGYGPDTYPIYFPQEEYLAKILYVGGPFELVDKPHNMYLQTAINMGLLSLLSMLTMFGIYTIWSFKLYFKNDGFSNYFAVVGAACFIAIFGYLVAGLFNDSLVSVAPVFWALFGIGLACNYLFRRDAL